MHILIGVIGDVLKLLLRCKENQYLCSGNVSISPSIEEDLKHILKYSTRNVFTSGAKLRFYISNELSLIGFDKLLCDLIIMTNRNL